MSCQDSKRVRQRQRQARYEARLRNGIGLFPTPLGASEIDVLISLNYLPEGKTIDKQVEILANRNHVTLVEYD
jgi:hypothetical protein